MKRGAGAAWLLSLTLLCSGGQSVAQPQPQTLSLDKAQSEVAQVVLEHFSERRDASFYSYNGKLLLDLRKPFGLAGVGSARYWTGDCKPQGELEQALAKFAKVSWSWAELPAIQGSEVISTELARSGNFLEPPRDAKGEVAKTVIRFAPPVISPDGQHALMDFEFRWSVHGAHAWYLLTLREQVWRVRCSDIQFFF